MLRGLLLLCVGHAAATAVVSPVTGENMNGEYMLAATPHGNTTWSTSFKDYPGGVESFDIFIGPINSTYGEVFWTGLPEVQLPPEIVARFKGKGMAMVGFESDQVRRGAGPNGEDVSVPINIAYNHHYGATMLGSGSRMETVPYDRNCPRGATNCSRSMLTPTPGWDRIAVEHTPSASGLPTSLWCGYSNGGEFRKSYHGIPPPFAQLIESPHSFSLSPMQIDTWNRDEMPLTGGKFVSGPVPRKGGDPKWPTGSLAPVNGSDAVYSGLLECPLTTRIRKQLTGGGWNDSVAANIACGQTKATCPARLETADTCFAGAKQLAGLGPSARVTTSQGSSTELPSGCSVQVNGTDVTVFFNTNAKSPACCGAGVHAVEGTQASLVNLGLVLSRAGGDTPGVTITLTGPDGVWFGVGFDTHVMANAPYAITVDGAGSVTERVLGDHVAGVVLNTSVTVVSNSVANGLRTVVMTRALKGLTPQHHDFDPTKLSLDFIAAVGASSVFAYHKEKTVGTIALWPRPPTPTKGGLVGFFGANVATDQMRNDWTGEVGYEFVPGSTISVSALGRAVNGGAGYALKATAAVTVWSVATKKPVATVQVGPGAAGADGFVYANLSQPVELEGGQTYYVTQTCTENMPDMWTNGVANVPEQNAAVAALGNGVYSDKGKPGVFPDNAETTPQFAGIVTFRAVVPPNLHPGPAAACVCSVPAAPFGQGTGTIKYLTTGEQIGFPLRCDPYPRETILRDHNPTCDIRTYAGGLSTCHHGWHLLDADQEVPWQDQVLSYHFKFRFYFQEYDPNRHVSAYGWNTGIGGDTAEYDVPQCPPGTPVEKCTHEISGLVTAPAGKMHFVGAHYHCHAPTCIRLEIYNNITGELICAEEPYHGAGNDVGGKDRFDEAGYIAQRVCLWGNSTYGLEKPPAVGGVPLFIRAITNSTYGHHGEMALPQMLVADL